MKKIGVFDSGMGGLSVVSALELAFPEASVLFVSDPDHMPYGDREPNDLLELVIPKIQCLVDQNCDVIVIACNTVTTTIIKKLRWHFPKQKIVGMEPMVKPASLLTETKKIAVCATPTTLKSKRYAWLKAKYAKDIEVIEPDCSDWARMIENNNVDRSKIRITVNTICLNGADVIVLGCTHYHWIEDIIKEVADGRAKVLQPEPAIINRVRTLLSD